LPEIYENTSITRQEPYRLKLKFIYVRDRLVNNFKWIANLEKLRHSGWQASEMEPSTKAGKKKSSAL
jgi:phosphoenolpyruvate carboxylase